MQIIHMNYQNLVSLEKNKKRMSSAILNDTLRVNKMPCICFHGEIIEVSLHHNLFITLLPGSKAKTVSVKEECCIQTKMH